MSRYVFLALRDAGVYFEAFWAAGADGKEREDWDLLVAVIASADSSSSPAESPIHKQQSTHQSPAFPYPLQYYTAT